MSGHSKWAQIKHKKAITDDKKGKVFSKLSKLITLAARTDGPNPDMNSQLRAIIEKAQAANMPKDNIDRAIGKGAGPDATQLSNVVYEAYGPGGSALIITGVTDNNNRTVAEVRKILGDFGAKMTPGGVLWLFEKTLDSWCPKTLVPLADPRDKEQLQALTEAVLEHDDVQGVYSNASYE